MTEAATRGRAMRLHGSPVHALLAAAAVLAAACGQKPGVADRQPPLAAMEAAAAGGITTTESDTAVPLSTDGSASTEYNGGSTLTSSTNAASDESAAGDEVAGTSEGSRLAAPSEPTGGSTVGVSRDRIKIGMHAPLTGAAPIPNNSIDKGKDIYWRWLESSGRSINGRQVDVVLKNDQLNPSHAVAMCKEMVEKDRVFLILGFSAADEVSSCARYAASVGVPYISGGTTEIGLDRLSNYFAVWQTFEDIGPLMADMFVDKLGARNERNGFITYSTPNTKDAHDSFINAMRERGAKVHYDRAVSKSSGPREAEGLAVELKQANIDNVYVLVTPYFWFQIAHSSANQNYYPQWTGISAIDEIVQHACRDRAAVRNARFFHFTPAFIDADRYDRNFARAGGTDSIMWALWGLEKGVGALLDIPGRNLTRERFVYLVERSTNIRTGVLPELNYRPDYHFGAQSMHLLRADCDIGRWVTEKAFAKDF